MKRALNKSSYKNKTDPLRGSGILSEKDRKGQNNIWGNAQLPLPAVCCANHSFIPLGGLENTFWHPRKHLKKQSNVTQWWGTSTKRRESRWGESCNYFQAGVRFAMNQSLKSDAHCNHRVLPLYSCFIQYTMHHISFIICWWSKITIPRETHSHEFIMCYMCVNWA